MYRCKKNGVHGSFEGGLKWPLEELQFLSCGNQKKCTRKSPKSTNAITLVPVYKCNNISLLLIF